MTMLEQSEVKLPTRLPDSRSRDTVGVAGLAELESAILATVAYRDLFDYPVTAPEIHRYLHGVRCNFEDVQFALGNGTFCKSYLTTDGSFFALKGREKIFDLRRRRQNKSDKLWKRALMYGSWLASLPFVKMVAVTGSLAVDNPGRTADVDFMLVTDGGRMWSVRLMAKVLQLFDAKFSSGELCVNHLVSTRALELDEPSRYVAQELTQMVPVYGFETYETLRQENPWADQYLPNAIGAPPTKHACRPRAPFIRRMAELSLRSPLGNALESWESRRKLYKYNETSFLLGRSTPFRPEATGHRRTIKKVIESAFEDRLRKSRQPSCSLRLLFGQAYHMVLDPKLHKAMQPFPPLGSLYAAGVARSLGHDVRIHDSMLSHSVYEWAPTVQVNNPDVVVLYEDNFNYLTKMCLLAMRDAALGMVRTAKSRGATVLVCSSDSADEPATYLQAGADFVLVGEGEDTFADLLGILAGSDERKPNDIAGLAFLNDRGELVTTGRRPVMRGLDELPMPAWDLIDLERYAEIWGRRHGRFALNMVTTRGCPYHCNWCAKPIWGQRYNARSPDHVVTELAQIQALTPVDYIWFMDDIFGLKPGWISKFADSLVDSNIDIRFKCLSRPDILLRQGETAALARAGCDIVWMGAESGSQKILDAMEKGTTVEMIDESCDSLRKQGIRVGLFIQFGYPGETKADIRETIKLVRRIMPDELGISISYPLPGTRFYDRVKAELGELRNWQDSDDLAMLFKGPHNTSFYRALHSYVHSDLGLRRSLANMHTPRKVAAVIYFALRRTWLSLAMAVFSRMPHKAMRTFTAEMDLNAAATPSEQPLD